jgi:hypothetical protein
MLVPSETPVALSLLKSDSPAQDSSQQSFWFDSESLRDHDQVNRVNRSSPVLDVNYLTVSEAQSICQLLLSNVRVVSCCPDYRHDRAIPSLSILYFCGSILFQVWHHAPPKLWRANYLHNDILPWAIMTLEGKY